MPLENLLGRKGTCIALAKQYIQNACSKKGQTSRSRSQGQKLWYHVKGLATRNTHMKYQSPITCGEKVIAKVKVFQK